ncbi:sialate O-acetylesterase [Mariniphaga sediminis]|uniref:sialate O-acetylesterase n=1 Tax=Mariniphaga sediminis TaxID=1628158 RepID=UPI0035679C33
MRKIIHRKGSVSIIFLLFLFGPSLLAISAGLKLPAVINNNMVLQQQSSCNFWGWAEPGDTVHVRLGWNGENKFCVADVSGKWRTDFTTPSAGGPYEIMIKADTTYALENILIGEVWVCSGQSNMEMPLQGYISMPVMGSNDFIAHSRNDNIRLFTVGKKVSTTPEDNCSGKWVVSEPKEAAGFSAVAYSFGKYLEEVLDIPIGLINTSWGGTPAEAWTSEATLLSEFGTLNATGFKTDELTSSSPSVLFNGMIHPLLNYTIRGVIWYQGTSNRKRPEQYSRLFPAMIKNWRRSWNQGEFPFYFVQNAPYSFRFDENTQSAFLREAQLKTMLRVPNTGMAVTMDVGDSLSNHPPEKIIVGKRLAYWALAKTYNTEGISYSGPVYKSMKVDENRAILAFDYAKFGLTSFGKELRHFEIAGDDKTFYPARAAVKDLTVEVWSPKVKKPVSVRYCWDNYVEGTLYNNAGLPASSFRTDEWK